MTATIEQRRQNLDRANEVRIRRSHLRALVTNMGKTHGRASAAHALADIIEAGDDALDKFLVWNLLAWVPRVYIERKQALLRAAEIHDEARQFGQLSERQRHLLADALRREVGS